MTWGEVFRPGERVMWRLYVNRWELTTYADRKSFTINTFDPIKDGDALYTRLSELVYGYRQ